MISLSNDPSAYTICTNITTYDISILSTFREWNTIVTIASTEFRVQLTFCKCFFFNICTLWKSNTNISHPQTRTTLIILCTFRLNSQSFTGIQSMSTSLSWSYTFRWYCLTKWIFCIKLRCIFTYFISTSINFPNTFFWIPQRNGI